MAKTVRYHPEVDILEHEDVTTPETKRVLIYGWDADNTQKVRLKVNDVGTLESGFGRYKMIIDKTTTPNVYYVGQAPRGTATSSSSWSVMKIDQTSGVIITWADGIWDNRTSLTYT